MAVLLENSTDEEFYTKLYESKKKYLFFHAYSILKNKSLAEEAVHDAFIAILKNLKNIQNIPDSKINYYLLVTIRRICYRKHEKEMNDFNHADIFDIDVVEETSTWELYSARALHEEMKKAIRKLNDVERESMYLRYEGLSYKEIGDMIKTTEKNVSVILTRARKKIKAHIVKELGESYAK